MRSQDAPILILDADDVKNTTTLVQIVGVGPQWLLSFSAVNTTYKIFEKRNSFRKGTFWKNLEGGKPVTKTRVFQHPITDADLETVWDEQTLRLLLEQSTDYEERRKIRARLRQVMAEQEACTELVEKASQDQIGTTFEGESQLLPLLQGLLEAPDTEQTADSGTESGEDQRNGLIAEVQNALGKLAANLRDDATDITPERRSSLLQLVNKLQAGLAVSVPISERRSSVQSRFRRRQRPNRHTVGVSSEELADARRLIEEISLHELTPQSSKTKITMLQKQNSEGCVGQNSTKFLTQKTVVKNAVAKPFSSSNSTVSGNSSSVQTPTDQSESLDLLFNEEVEKRPDGAFRSISLDGQNIRKSSSGDVSIKSIQQAVQEAAARKSTENLLESEETDEDTTMKVLSVKSEEKKDIEPIKPLPQPDIVMQSNPIYKEQREEKINKFNSKKLKMKRANTIDIPKPLNFYEEDDSDSSLPEEDYYQRRRSNYLALRGPIRVGNPTVPVFEPKTDNDKKFLAFINKHNDNTTVKAPQVKNSLWSKPENSKFGNIKTAFEKASQNSARQFWKSADDAITTGPKYDGPKISKQSARNLRQMFEEKQKESNKPPWSSNIVTGSLKVLPQPLPVNKFSHAPQSAFKPLPKKAPPSNLQISKTPLKAGEKDPESPLFLYSPKPSNEPSPKPWLNTSGESRVLSLAASKFENVTPQEPTPIRPRKLSKDKLVSPFQQQASEKLSAPFLVKSVEQNSNVRQLSGQYNNLSGKNNDYNAYSAVKYVAPAKNQQYELNKSYQYVYPRQPQTQSHLNQHTQELRYQAQPQHQHLNQRNQDLRHYQQYEPQQNQDLRYQAQTHQPQHQHLNQQNQDLRHQAQAHKPQHNEPQYTSTYQYQPQIQKPQQIQETRKEAFQNQTQSPKYESQVSVESLKEYNAVNSRVMTGPVCQQATTVRQKSPMNRDEHDMAAAFNLRNSLQKITPRPDTVKEEPKKITPPLSPPNNYQPKERSQSLVSPRSFSYRPREEPVKAISPHSFSYKSTATKRSAPLESLEINDNGESVVTSKFQIPVINVPQPESPRPTPVQIASKANSWNQICMQNQQPAHKPSPRASPNARTVSKSKSSHSLALPKQFEAGMSKDEMALKRKTMEAFLIGTKSPPSPKTVKRSINRLKTSEKVSTFRQSTGLARSRTLPDIVCPEMLDEDNVDKAFEDLFRSSS